ncbi:transmembrane protein 32 protein [Stemphylium lycopersici]|uniref:Transmembrane protein 32 protein n=1 Tax=Stemphylium lycopersici TaxID=183478 RepID=A0A364MRV8_STELY|nr:transmembrane protein 32 protein [Stemphylium lycopersici]RAR11260.1 transmembrane protein 32 protein [Stemphylium lycopersici]
MAIIGTALNGVGALLLTHAVYSTHEHTATFATTPLPLDISLELLTSILLLSLGIVISFAPLKPIQYAQWAGQISREGRHSEGRYTREGEAVLSEGDPYAFLGLEGGVNGKSEGRRGFFDIKGKRKEFENWMREGGKQ